METILTVQDYGFCVSIVTDNEFDKKSKAYRLDVLQEVMDELERVYYCVKEEEE